MKKCKQKHYGTSATLAIPETTNNERENALGCNIANFDYEYLVD